MKCRINNPTVSYTHLDVYKRQGYGNVMNVDKIVSVVSPDSAPIKRLVQAAKDAGTAVDATQGLSLIHI